ncbi:MAG: phosphatase [Actinomycetota bacterium]
MVEIDLSQTRAALVAAGVAGPHQSHSRHNAISKIHSLLSGDSEEAFGLTGVTKYSAGEILSFVAELTGCSPDMADLEGYDTIDPDLTINGLLRAGEVLREAAHRGATLLCATGHPSGLLEHHIRVVDSYRRAGGKVLLLRENENISAREGRHYEVRYVGGVGCFADWGSLRHTHSATPMEALLEAEPWPDLVVGDHGFAGAAIERGIPTIAIMDVNDPALAIAWAEKKQVTIVPMDDNRIPRSYEPSWQLLRAIIEGGP